MDKPTVPPLGSPRSVGASGGSGVSPRNEVLSQSPREPVSAMEGWLYKKGEKGIVKKWRKRYFEAHNGALTYAEAKDAPPLGTVDLATVKLIERGAKGTFAVHVPGRVYELAVLEDAGAAAVERWVAVLQLQCPGARVVDDLRGAATTPAAKGGGASPRGGLTVSGHTLFRSAAQTDAGLDSNVAILPATVSGGTATQSQRPRLPAFAAPPLGASPPAADDDLVVVRAVTPPASAQPVPTAKARQAPVRMSMIVTPSSAMPSSAPPPPPIVPEDDANRKRAQVCQEIVQSELAYADQLEKLASCYQQPLLLAGVLDAESNRKIFSNLDVLLRLHTELVALLQSRTGGAAQPVDSAFPVGELLSSISPALTLYVDFVNGFGSASTLLRELNETKRSFARALAKLTHGKQAGLYALETLLVVPVQRVPRYVLLMKEVLRHTPETHGDYAACNKALAQMERIGNLINEKKREFENAQRIAYISQRLGPGNGLMEPHRKIIFEATMEVKLSRMDRAAEYESIPFFLRRVLLCNDSMILLRVENEDTDAERVFLVDHMRWGSASEGAVLDDSAGGDVFSVGHRRDKQLHLLRAPSADDKSAWVASFRAAMASWREQGSLQEQRDRLIARRLLGVQVRITGSVKLAPPQQQKGFRVFIIELSGIVGAPLQILKRHHQIKVLHQRLLSRFGEAHIGLPKFPPSKRMQNKSDAYQRQREVHLTEYLHAVLAMDGVLEFPEVCTFLTTTYSVLGEEEAVSAFTDGDAPMAATSAASTVPPAAAAAAPVSSPARVAASTPYNQQPALALYDYESDEPGSLALRKGQSLLVLTRERDAAWCWCRREVDGVEGWCPVAFINDGTPFARPRAARQLVAPPAK